VSLIFDQVAVKKAGGYNLIGVDAWLQLPLGEQYDLITKSKVQFLRGGEAVNTLEAVKSMAAWKAARRKAVVGADTSEATTV
jgi:hypothetical protein